MRRCILIHFLLALICLGLVSFAAAPTAAHRKQQVEIRKLLDDQVAAWNRGDIDGFMQGYWNSPELVFTSGGVIRRGWQSTLERYRSSYPDRSSMGQLSFGNLEIHVLSPTAAWVMGTWHLTRAHDEPHGIFTLVLQRFPVNASPSDGGWKIVHDHTSSSQ